MYDTRREKEALPGIRRHIFEHLVNLDKALFLLEVAFGAINAEKSKFYMAGVKIVG